MSVINGMASNIDNYTATIEWGDGNFVTASVVSVGDPTQGVFNIRATCTNPPTDPNVLVLAEVEYSATGISRGFAGRLGALSEPIQVMPAVENLTRAPRSPPPKSTCIGLDNETNRQRNRHLLLGQRTITFPSHPSTTTVAGTATSYADTSLPGNTQYYYQICAIQNGTASQLTLPVNAWTLPAVTNVQIASAATISEHRRSAGRGAAHRRIAAIVVSNQRKMARIPNHIHRHGVPGSGFDAGCELQLFNHRQRTHDRSVQRDAVFGDHRRRDGRRCAPADNARVAHGHHA